MKPGDTDGAGVRRWEVRAGACRDAWPSQCTFSVSINLQGSRKAAPIRVQGWVADGEAVDLAADRLCRWMNDPSTEYIPPPLDSGVRVRITKAGHSAGLCGPVSRKWLEPLARLAAGL